MKKIITGSLFILMVGIAPAFAQFKQGSIMAGGSASFQSTSQKDKSGNTSTKTETDNTFQIMPQVGYFVIDNLAVGAGVTLMSSTSKDLISSSKTTETDFVFAPFARYYYNKFFGQATFQVGSGKNSFSSVDFNSSTKTTFTGLNLGVGYAFLLNEHVAIEPLVGYQVFSVKEKGSSDKTVTSGLFLQVGFQIYLHK